MDLARCRSTSRPHARWPNPDAPAHHEGSRAADGAYEVSSLGAYADRPWPESKRSSAAQVTLLDAHLGALRTLLDSLQIADRTLVIFLSDSGATLLRRDQDGVTNIVGRWFNGTQSYRGFKGDLFDGGLRVPGIAYWPGRTRAGSQSRARVDFTDLHATLLHVAGLPAPNIDGRSCLPLLTGSGAVALKPYKVWYSPDRNQSAVLEGRSKVVWMRDTARLFDLQLDAGEQHDLATSCAVVAMNTLRATTTSRASEHSRFASAVPAFTSSVVALPPQSGHPGYAAWSCCSPAGNHRRPFARRLRRVLKHPPCDIRA